MFIRKIKIIIIAIFAIIGILLGNRNIVSATEREIYIAGLSEWPLSYYDNVQEEYVGVLPELLTNIGEQHGITFCYFEAESDEEYKRLAKNLQVDAIWLEELKENERQELGFIQGTIRLDFVTEENAQSIVLYYTESMNEEDARVLEEAFAAVTQEEVQGLLLKYSSTYMEGEVLPKEFWYAVIIFGFAIVVAAIAWGIYARRKYINKNEALKNRVPGIEEFRRFYDESMEEKNRINYAVVKMGFGLDRIRRTYGYAEADEVLKMIIDLLKSYITDENELMADAGNHQLIALLRCMDEQQLMERIQHMQEEVEKEFIAQKKDYYLEFRMGLYRLGSKVETVKDVEQNCEIALIHARKTAEEYVWYNKSIYRKVAGKYELEQEVERALENHEFTIYLQPLISLRDGKVLGAETLVRWKHPSRGMLTPGDFLSVMKHKRLLGRMNMEVYRQGCSVLRDELAKGRELRMLFHFTIDNVEDKNFAENLEAVAEQYGINRRQIMIQLDEMLDYGYESILQENTSKLKTFGFYVCMDGLELERAFLQYLQGNIDGVKFRQGVIKHLERPGAKETFAKAVTLCQSMNLEMICAGVESEIQKQVVSELGCAFASGFYFYYPMEPNVFHEIVDECFT